MKHKDVTCREGIPALANTTYSSGKVGLGGYLGKKSSRQLFKDLRDKQNRF